LKSQVGHADFYLINPAGVTFGQNAQIDVPAAFHASTASQLRLKDGALFSAINPSASSFSSASPAAFGFVGNATNNNGLIEADGARLAVQGGQTLDIVAREIRLANSAQLNAPGGEIRLVAQQGQGEISLERATLGNLPLPQQTPAAGNAGAISLEDSEALASGEGGGRVGLWGGVVSLAGNQNPSHVGADNTGSVNAGPASGVELHAQSLSVVNSPISTDSFGSGNAGAIHATVGGDVAVVQGEIKSRTFGAGNAGDINLSAGGSLTVDGQANPNDNAGIFSNAREDSTGNTGNVTVSAGGDISVINGGVIATGAFESAKGNTGTVTVAAGGKLVLDGQGGPNTNGIFAQANGDGDAGDIVVSAKNGISVVNGGVISGTAEAKGRGGDVIVSTGGDIYVDRQGYPFPTGIFATADWGEGDGGNLKIDAKGNMSVVNGGEVASSTFSNGNSGSVDIRIGGKLLVDCQGSPTATGIFAQANRDSTGNAGNLRLYVKGDVSVLDGGAISSATFSTGDAGSLTLKTDGNLLVDRKESPFVTGIFAQTNTGSTGNAGNVAVSATGDIMVIKGGKISSSAFALGNAGDVSVTAGGKLTIDNQGAAKTSGILSEAAEESQGNAGNIQVHVQGPVAVLGGGQISSATFAQGKAGSVSLETGSKLIVDGRGSSDATGLFSQANVGSTGDADNISVTAKGDVFISNGGTISSSTQASGKGGAVAVAARHLSLSKGTISALAGADSSGQTGDVSLRLAGNLSLSRQGQITIANAATAANPGAIMPGTLTIRAQNIFLQDSQITTQATGNLGAGNIALRYVQALQPRHSFITTEANLGAGGEISIIGGERLSLQDSAITTSVKAGNGDGGAISVQTYSLILQTGKIEANANSGNGGNIQLNVKAFLASSNTLNGIELGAGNPFAAGQPRQSWAPFQSGNNVIQAVSDNGVSGAISLAAPQLNLSGALTNLGGPKFDRSRLLQDYCGIMGGSSLTLQGQGALPRRSRELILR
jgi:large exoprotein involved in heme utilization and adhesion